tara:strand:+ start:988 stop:1749 length:762 start_codon:yes stop_codon:yes gene_type:complete
MIDSHCHLDHQPLSSNLNDIIKRSKKVGIEKLLTICTTLQSFQEIIKIVKMDKMIFGTFGIHPHESNKDIVTKELINNYVVKNEKIIGIGETGLDFFYNNSDKISQIKSFEQHIEASIELNYPLIVHSRNAEKETFEILNEYKNKSPKILMHCFTGSTSFAKKLFNLNCFFSASGIITFKNSVELQETFKQIPLDKLLIETDSPYLAPVPNRGKKNEPSFIKFTVSKLAEIKRLEVSKIISATTKNFNNLFFN